MPYGQSFNDTLTNDIFSFEQKGPGIWYSNFVVYM